MRLPTLPLLIAASSLLIGATAADAATVASDGAGGYVYRAAPGETNRVLLYGGMAGRVRFYDEVAVTGMPDECVQDRPNDAECPAGPVRVELADGPDTLGLDSYAAGPLTVDGGDGDDELGSDGAPAGVTLLGGAGRDLLRGTAGRDVLRGGPGDDRLWGQAGDDELRGEAGDDHLEPDNGKAPGSDVVDGGPGIDSVGDWIEPGATAVPISVSIDGVADDGRPGEADNVIDVERATSHVSGRFVLSEGRDDWLVYANADGGASTVLGRGGDDRIVGEDHDETFDGGAGNDYLEGGRRNDTLTGGPGADTIIGDESDTGCTWAPEYCLVFGNDVIHARDGEADTIDCGPGSDRAVVDAIDVHSGCETVETAGSTGPPTGPGGPPTTGEPITEPGANTALKVVRTSLGRALRSGFKVRVSGLPAGRKVVLTAKRTGKVVARGSARAGEQGTAVVRLRFTAAGRKALKRAGRAKLTVSGAGGRVGVTLRR